MQQSRCARYTAGVMAVRGVLYGAAALSLSSSAVWVWRSRSVTCHGLGLSQSGDAWLHARISSWGGCDPCADSQPSSAFSNIEALWADSKQGRQTPLQGGRQLVA